MSLTTAVYIQYTTQVFPNVPLHVQKALYALSVTLSICFFHVSSLSSVAPRYFTSLDSWVILLKRIGSLSPYIFLFLVKGITTVLFGFTDNFVLSHRCWTVHRAVW
jgi:hypothetical protein